MKSPGGAAKEVAPDESCEADASGLASFSLCEGDGETASPDSANVTSFFGVGVRLSSSKLAASPIGKACGVDWLTWGAGGSVPSTTRGGSACACCSLLFHHFNLS